MSNKPHPKILAYLSQEMKQAKSAEERAEYILAKQRVEKDAEWCRHIDRVYQADTTTIEYIVRGEGDQWDDFLGCRKSQIVRG